MSDFLTTMARESANRAARASVQSADLDRPVVPLVLDAFDVIAEIKNRSPSEGALGSVTADHGERATRYAEGGAAAISVLTEPTQFDGELTHINDVSAATSSSPVPIIRKDFLVDPVQVLEARAAGASGVLLIVTMLPDKKLSKMLDCAHEHSMFVLLESFDEADLERSSALLNERRYVEQAESGRLLFGINARDLRTLHVDPDRLKTLAPKLPQGVVCVAESGLFDGQDAGLAAEWGYRAALVGTALMRSSDPAALIREMLDSGRERRAA